MGAASVLVWAAAVDGRAVKAIMAVAREWALVAATGKQSFSNDQPGGFPPPPG